MKNVSKLTLVLMTALVMSQSTVQPIGLPNFIKNNKKAFLVIGGVALTVVAAVYGVKHISANRAEEAEYFKIQKEKEAEDCKIRDKKFRNAFFVAAGIGGVLAAAPMFGTMVLVDAIKASGVYLSAISECALVGGVGLGGMAIAMKASIAYFEHQMSQ